MTAPMLSSSRFRARRGDFFAGFGRGDFEHLAGHGFGESVYARNAVFYFEDGTDFFDVQVSEVSCFDFAKEDVLDFAGAESGCGGHFLGVGLRAFLGEGPCASELVKNITRGR